MLKTIIVVVGALFFCGGLYFFFSEILCGTCYENIFFTENLAEGFADLFIGFVVFSITLKIQI